MTQIKHNAWNLLSAIITIISIIQIKNWDSKWPDTKGHRTNEWMVEVGLETSTFPSFYSSLLSTIIKHHAWCWGHSWEKGSQVLCSHEAYILVGKIDTKPLHRQIERCLDKSRVPKSKWLLKQVTRSLDFVRKVGEGFSEGVAFKLGPGGKRGVWRWGCQQSKGISRERLWRSMPSLRN